MDEYDKRSYSRASHIDCDVKVSQDKAKWRDANVSDLSSGGLKLKTHVEYEEGSVLWFDLCLNGFMSEFEVMVKGIVRHKSRGQTRFHYGIQFVELSPDIKIRIDENVHLDRPVEGGLYNND